MSEHLTDAQVEEFRARLLEERGRLLERAGVPSDREPDPGDHQDAASGEAHSYATLALSDLDRPRLREIDDALERLTDGTYGICEETGEPIPLARLRAQPTTRYTVEALEILEEEQARERVRQREHDDSAY